MEVLGGGWRRWWAHMTGTMPTLESQKLRAKMKEVGKDALLKVHMYPGCEHAFVNKDRPEVYDKAAHQLAFDRTVQFFQTELK